MRTTTLAALGGTVLAPPLAPLTIPEPADAKVAALRPTAPIYATLQVGPQRAFTTVEAALARVATLRQAIPETARIVVLIEDGYYEPTDTLGLGGVAGNTDLIAASGTRDNGGVAIGSSADSSGVLHTYGNVYVEGIDFGQLTGGPKYPLHLLATGRSIFARCGFYSLDDTGSGSGAAVGMDGDAGSYSLFYDSELSSPDGATWNGNLHGASSNASPLKLIFDDCTTNNVLDYNDLGSGQADQLWFVNSTGPGFTPSGANVQVHTSGSYPSS